MDLTSRRGVRLAGVVHLPPGVSRLAGVPTVVLCHGMESTKEGTKHQALAARLPALGYACLRFDFSYVGESDGRFEDLTISGEVEDLAGACDHLWEAGVPRIGLVGSSLGGAVVVRFAGDEPRVQAMVTFAGVSRPGEILTRMDPATLNAWRTDGYRQESTGRLNSTFLDDCARVDVLGAAARVQAATLVLHGEADRVVPVDDAHALFDVLPEPKELVVTPGCDHRYSDPGHLAELLERTVGWIHTHLTL